MAYILGLGLNFECSCLPVGGSLQLDEASLYHAALRAGGSWRRWQHVRGAGVDGGGDGTCELSCLLPPRRLGGDARVSAFVSGRSIATGGKPESLPTFGVTTVRFPLSLFCFVLLRE